MDGFDNGPQIFFPECYDHLLKPAVSKEMLRDCHPNQKIESTGIQQEELWPNLNKKTILTG